MNGNSFKQLFSQLVSSGEGNVNSTMDANSFKLFSHLVSSGEGNVFLSPLSVAVALRLAQHGCTPGSAAAAALSSYLGGEAPGQPLVLPDAEGAMVTLANSVWVRSDILADYIEAVQRHHGALVRPMPAQGAAPINAWVEEATRGMIKELVGDSTVLNPLTRVLLVNAVHFKGTWARTFSKKATLPAKFHGPDGPVKCAMMQRSGDITLAQTDLATAVSLPYHDGKTRAIFLLPKAEGRAGAADLACALPEHWDGLRQSLRPGTQVQLRLPRFKMEGEFKLAAALRALGLGPCFDEDGGFLRMSEDPGIHIADVLHKAACEVDEEGTEAAAATAVVMMTRSAVPRARPLCVTFDRPFVFVIEAGDGTVLFTGLVSTV